MLPRQTVGELTVIPLGFLLLWFSDRVRWIVSATNGNIDSFSVGEGDFQGNVSFT